MADSKIDEFYEQLQTLPRLISDLALSIAEAQRRMDENYLKELALFTSIILPLLQDGTGKAEQYLTLFKAIAPSRYQFTETVVEVRADLQMSTMSQTEIGGNIGIKTPVFAIAINAAYTKRSAYDYQAAALVRTQLNAVPANPDLLDKLLDAGSIGAQLPNADRYKAFADAFKDFPKRLQSPLGSPQ
ncbi:MAG TPA: hypothetical protein VI306_16255 [Pyrinomonadaceae bacterium]